MLQLGAADCVATKVYTEDTAGLNTQPVISLPVTPAAGDQVKVLYVAAPAAKPIADVLFPTQITSCIEANANAGPADTVIVTGVLDVSQPVKVSSTETYKVVVFPTKVLYVFAAVA